MNNKSKKVKTFIIYAIAAILIFSGANALGHTKKYDDTYIANCLEKQEKEFPVLIEVQSENEKHLNEKNSLKTEISELQNKVNSISEFEEKQEAYNLELQELQNQVANISIQKTEKEQTLNDIEYELSQY